jgi:hypothetical protein
LLASALAVVVAWPAALDPVAALVAVEAGRVAELPQPASSRRRTTTEALRTR